MHPPDFSIHQRLSDWPDCRLELHCPAGSGSIGDYPVRLLLTRYGDHAIGKIVARLRCKCCGGKPAPVFLVAGLMRRPGQGGPGPSWAVQIVAQAN